MKFSSLVERVRGSTADVWDSHYEAVAARSRGEDIIVLSVGDPDFDTPRGVMDAAFNAMQAGDTHYTSIKGNEALRQCIAEKHQRSSGQSVDADNIIITSGGQNAYFPRLSVFAKRGTKLSCCNRCMLPTRLLYRQPEQN